MKYHLVLLSISLTLITFGCNTIPNRNFTGSPSYSSPYATVFASPSLISDKIYISEIDGHSTSSTWFSKMPTVADVTNGDHKFKFFAEDKKSAGTYSGILSFTTSQGTTYKVTLEPIEEKALSITNISSLKISENISPSLILQDREFNKVSNLLLYWGIIKSDDNLYIVLESKSQSEKLLNSLEEHLGIVPHSQAIQIIGVAKEIFDKIQQESAYLKIFNLDKKLVVHDIAKNSFITSTVAKYDYNLKFNNRVYNWTPLTTYHKEDKTKNIPKIDFSQFNTPKNDMFNVNNFDIPKNDTPNFNNMKNTPLTDMPKIELPKNDLFNTPKVDIPNFNIPDISTPKFDTLKID